MIHKKCPWCRNKLGFGELLLLDEHSPKKCKNCGNFLKTSSANSIISVVIPVIMVGAALVIFNLDFLISLSLLLLIPVLRIVLAEPTKYSLGSSGNACLQCKQTNIGFGYPNSKICDKCLLSDKQSNSQTFLR